MFHIVPDVTSIHSQEPAQIQLNEVGRGMDTITSNTQYLTNIIFMISKCLLWFTVSLEILFYTQWQNILNK